jgi:hypothetical protein
MCREPPEAADTGFRLDENVHKNATAQRKLFTQNENWNS